MRAALLARTAATIDQSADRDDLPRRKSVEELAAVPLLRPAGGTVLGKRMPRRPSLVCFDTCLPPMSHGVPQQRHAPCHGASATRPSTLLTLTTNCNQSAPRFPLFVTCFWSQATSERFSVLPPPRERPPPPSPSPTSLSRPPLTLAACCEAATTSSKLFSRYEYEYVRSAAPGIGDVGGGGGDGDDDDDDG